MSDPVSEKAGYASGTSDDGSQSAAEIFERPTGLKGVYYHPLTQVSMLGFVCFMGPGLFNALNGLGAGGQVDSTTSANANVALYATFSFFAFFAGYVLFSSHPSLHEYSFLYKCKPSIKQLYQQHARPKAHPPHREHWLRALHRLLSVSSPFPPPARLSKLDVHQIISAVNIHSHAGAFVITAGAILGICAGLLWTAQGSIMLAYPTESEKGKYIGVFWAIFNLGGVVGASVSLGQNFHSTVRTCQGYIGRNDHRVPFYRPTQVSELATMRSLSCPCS